MLYLNPFYSFLIQINYGDQELYTSVGNGKWWQIAYRSNNLSLTDIQHAQQWKMFCCQLSNPAMHKNSYEGSIKVTVKVHTVHVINFRQQTPVVFMDAWKSRIISILLF